MLKIKDSVDLKELEKFGFEKNTYHWCKGGIWERPLINKEDKRSLYVDVYSREIDKENINFAVIDAEENDVKDLIEAGYVEKVEEE